MKKSTSILIASLLLLSSCGSYSKMFSADLDKLVPPDFGTQTTTILVEKSNSRITKIYKESFDKNYKGPYLIVSKEDISASYADTDNYRYVFGSSERMTGNPGTGGYQKVFTVYLLDRKTGKDYNEANISGSLLEKHIKAYLAKLEQARKK